MSSVLVDGVNTTGCTFKINEPRELFISIPWLLTESMVVTSGSELNPNTKFKGI